MIQLKPTISLKIDKIKSDGICIRVSLWILFYITITIMSYNGKSRFNKDVSHTITIQDDKNTTFPQSSQYQMCKAFPHPLQEMYLKLHSKIVKDSAYLLMGQKAIEQINIKNISLPEFEYSLTGYASSQLHDDNYTNCSLKQTDYQQQLININNSIKLVCKLDLKDEETKCEGYIDEIETHGFTNFMFNIEIHYKNYTKMFDSVYFEIEYENNLYYDFQQKFQVIFLILSVYAIYYLHNKLNDYPRQNWLRIHLWLQFLLILMFFYNLPISILRFQFPQLIHMVSKLQELLVQSSLFYFWLDIFELQLKDQQESPSTFTIWNIFKFLLVSLYTLPQALLDLYIFYMKEVYDQYDPIQQLKYYEQFNQFQIGCLLSYLCFYAYLLYQSQQSKKIVVIDQQSQDEKEIRKHDPFVEGMEIKQEEEQERSYKALHVLSLICLLGLVYYQRNRIVDSHSFTSSSTINEYALLNIYLCIVNQLYMPYQEMYEEEKGKNVYGDIELEEQGRKSQVDQDQLWKNIQKQINEQTHSNSDEEL